MADVIGWLMVECVGFRLDFEFRSVRCNIVVLRYLFADKREVFQLVGYFLLVSDIGVVRRGCGFVYGVSLVGVALLLSYLLDTVNCRRQAYRRNVFL